MLIGATGLIGKAGVERVTVKHEIISVGHPDGDFPVDIGSKKSKEDLI